MLDDHERVECDDNHLVECPCKTKCLKGISKRKERQALDQHQRNRDETVNERFDNWVFLHQKFWHSISKHHTCFNCVAILTQLAIEHGEELIPITYDDSLTDNDLGL